MQQVLMFTGLAGLLGAFAIVTSRWTWGTTSFLGRMMLGVVAGVAGALLIGFWQTDLIPDPLEVALQPVLLAIGTFAALFLVLVHLRAR